MVDPTIRVHSIRDQKIAFIVETPRLGFIHACSPEDICHLLTLLPADDWLGIQAFVLRQSTKKQLLVAPTWGRLAVAANVGVSGRPDIIAGPAIILEAILENAALIWSRSQTGPGLEELGRLRLDGHTIEEDVRNFTIRSNPNSARATQLYRTIPHEIGHWVDWKRRVELPLEKEPWKNNEGLVDAYWKTAKSERESFAHRYAQAVTLDLFKQGELPFTRR